MAYLTRQPGSPFWYAVLTFTWDDRTKRIWRSTQCTDKSVAEEIGNKWTAACWYAKRAELSGHIDRLLEEIGKETKNPQALKNSRELFSYLLKETQGEEIRGENLAAYFNEWFEMDRRKLKPNTIQLYQNDWNAFLASLPDKKRTGPIGKIGPVEIARHQTKLSEQGLSGATVNVKLAVIRKFFRWAQRQGRS